MFQLYSVMIVWFLIIFRYLSGSFIILSERITFKCRLLDYQILVSQERESCIGIICKRDATKEYTTSVEKHYRLNWEHNFWLTKEIRDQVKRIHRLIL